MKVNKTQEEITAYNTANADYIAVGLVEAWEPIPTPPPRTTPRHHGGWGGRGCAVLPIGLVNLTTAKNVMFGTMWDCWEESEKGTNTLVQEGSNYRVIHSSGAMDNLPGDTMTLCHDQTGSRIGFHWTVVKVVPHTKAGLLELKRITGKSSLAFSTYK